MFKKFSATINGASVDDKPLKILECLMDNAFVSGSDYGIWNPVRTVDVEDKRLLIDKSAFEQLKGKYIFSRIEISNSDEAGFKLVGEYSDAHSPYTIWVYSL